MVFQQRHVHINSRRQRAEMPKQNLQLCRSDSESVEEKGEDWSEIA